MGAFYPSFGSTNEKIWKNGRFQRVYAWCRLSGMVA